MIKKKLSTNRLKYGHSICSNVPAGSDSESSDESGAQVTEEQTFFILSIVFTLVLISNLDTLT